MRRRLTVSILVLLAATLVVTTLTSYLLIRRATVASAEQQLAQQTRAIGVAFSGRSISTRAALVRQLHVIERAGAFDGIAVVALEPDGSVSGRLPRGCRSDLKPSKPSKRVARSPGTPPRCSCTRSYPSPRAVPFRSPHCSSSPDTSGIRSPDSATSSWSEPSHSSSPPWSPRPWPDGSPCRSGQRWTRPAAWPPGTSTRPCQFDLGRIRNSRSWPPRSTPWERTWCGRDQERQFLLSISHELRTPLTSIRGYADAVVEGATDDLTGAVSIIGAEARRLERLVRDLLDLARLDADRFSLSVGPVDAREVARQAADGFRPAATSLGLTLDTDLGPDVVPLWVEADPDRLAQIMANLLENASAFARSRIVLAEGAASGHPTLTVSDDGPGIPADELPRIFERHVTSDRVPRRSTGSGLGLAIVVELATAMGADVRAESPLEGDAGQGHRDPPPSHSTCGLRSGTRWRSLRR